VGQAFKDNNHSQTAKKSKQSPETDNIITPKMRVGFLALLPWRSWGQL